MILRHRPRPRRPGHRRQHLSRRHVQRGLSAHHAGRRRDAAAVPAVLVSRRHSEPRRAGNAGLDPRRRRARLLAGARVRRGVRQSRPDRRLRRRRRRGRDRPAGDELALEQVPQSGAATARCCRSCTSTATRSPARPCSRAFRHEELDSLLRGYGYAPIFVEGDEPDADAPADGRGARPRHRRDRRDPAAGARDAGVDASGRAGR